MAAPQAPCWRLFRPGLLKRIAVDHGLLGDRRADRLQEKAPPKRG
jgi:hypothetical protein